MAFEGIIGALVVGTILGVLGRLVAPGKQKIPFWLTILVGIAAAMIGTWIASWFGWHDTPGVNWLQIAIQIGVAAVGVTVVAGWWAKRKGIPASANR